MVLRCDHCGCGGSSVADQEELDAAARYVGRPVHWRCATRDDHLRWLRRSTTQTAETLKRLDPDMELAAEVYEAYFASLDLLDALEDEAA